MDCFKTGSKTLFFQLSQLDNILGWQLRILLAILLFVGSVIFIIKGFSLKSTDQIFNQYWTLALIMLWGCVSQISPAIKNYSESKNKLS
jgi:hypothetical protein